jgi:uncharacterized protein YndB with AHSA1/START domain
MTPKAALTQETRAARVELEIRIEAPPARVWEAIVARPDAWWIPEMRVLERCEEVCFEPRAGGRLYERRGDGGELLWFTTLALEPERSLQFSGHLVPPWGGPATTYLTLRLEEEGGATRLLVSNYLNGVVGDELLPQIESGWRFLFESGLKRLVETGSAGALPGEAPGGECG